MHARAFRKPSSSIGYVFLIHEAKLQLYEQYIKAARRSITTLDQWRKKDPDFDKLVALFQVGCEFSSPDSIPLLMSLRLSKSSAMFHHHDIMTVKTAIVALLS